MAVDLSAIAKWPNVPACYGWLSLDRRGDWRLQGEKVAHRGLIEFINRQYGVDESGNWFLQNGPQRVFVALAYTPWVFRIEADGLMSHTGQPAGNIKAALIDEEGNILLETELGIGLLDDRDLAEFLSACHDKSGGGAGEAAFTDLMQGRSGTVSWRGLDLCAIHSSAVPTNYGFIAAPGP